MPTASLLSAYKSLFPMGVKETNQQSDADADQSSWIPPHPKLTPVSLSLLNSNLKQTVHLEETLGLPPGHVALHGTPNGNASPGGHACHSPPLAGTEEDKADGCTDGNADG
eukprot:CAMPEP_0178623140 /NCGR_PEP_ID=MMETSP0698-20121128/6686_1 /TAXON_ID=265572 /ORGANISM="Extubocellulus spinifer, Strain CCMP396" /LENGTH=110 /DNA_ID=CAMNT_0020262217 /DNA_START=198 /DNA_END=530 /DNA_ORIENTATION=+